MSCWALWVGEWVGGKTYLHTMGALGDAACASKPCPVGKFVNHGSAGQEREDAYYVSYRAVGVDQLLGDGCFSDCFFNWVGKGWVGEIAFILRRCGVNQPLGLGKR